MKKIVLTVVVFMVSSVSIISQTASEWSQYMFNSSSFNPAAVGEKGMIEAVWQHRIQWVGMPNAGQSDIINLNLPVDFLSTTHGVGLKVIDDKVGLFSNTSVYLQYAYKLKTTSGVWSFGTELGLINAGFEGDSVHSVNIGDYHESTDPVVPSTNVQGMGFDIGLGAWYSSPKFEAGISYAHLNQPVISWSDQLDYQEKGVLFITGGYNWTLIDPKMVIKPTTLFKTDFVSYQWDASARMEYDNKYWGGLSYRWGDAVVFFAGINAIAGLNIGYAYDLPVSQIIKASSGSHEFLISYSFEYKLNKAKHKYKSIRIL